MSAVVKAIAAYDQNLAVNRIRTMSTVLDEFLAAARVGETAMLVLAAIAIVIATMGLYATIVGVRLTDPADTTSQEHVAGASIAVYLEFAHVPVDSSELPQHKLLGTITSDAQGAFQLTNVPGGDYRLDVTPPPGSPYTPGTSGTVSFTAHIRLPREATRSQSRPSTT